MYAYELDPKTKQVWWIAGAAGIKKPAKVLIHELSGPGVLLNSRFHDYITSNIFKLPYTPPGKLSLGSFQSMIQLVNFGRTTDYHGNANLTVPQAPKVHVSKLSQVF
eukprot:sb/3477655/